MMRLLAACLLLAATASAFESYDGHVVIRVTPRDANQLRRLHSLQKEFPLLDFWQEPSTVNRPVDIRLAPDNAALVQKRLFGMDWETHIDDVGRLVRDERMRLDAKRATGQRWMNWTDYDELEDIEAWLVEKADEYEFVTLESVGQSFEGREVWLLRMDKPNSNGDEKTVAFIDCNIHAREWITSASCTWMIEQLLTDPAYNDVMEQWDFHIIPVLNPDGFKYSHTDDRLWRKTRSNFGDPCLGTDPNRNWDFIFGGPGTSDNPCSEIYHGPFAFSEPECAAASEYILERSDAIKIYMTVHSYSQLILFPYGYTTEPPEDYDDLKGVGLIGEAAIEATHNTQWETGTPSEILYINAGTSRDWAKGAAGIKFSYTFELRDTGEYGFVLPPEQILPASEEIFNGIRAMLDAVLAFPQ